MLVNSNSPMMRQFPASLDLLQAPAFSSPVFSPPQSFRREFSKAHCLSQAQYLAPLKALLFRLSRLDPEMLSWVLCLVGGGRKTYPEHCCRKFCYPHQRAYSMCASGYWAQSKEYFHPFSQLRVCRKCYEACKQRRGNPS